MPLSSSYCGIELLLHQKGLNPDDICKFSIKTSVDIKYGNKSGRRGFYNTTTDEYNRDNNILSGNTGDVTWYEMYTSTTDTYDGSIKFSEISSKYNVLDDGTLQIKYFNKITDPTTDKIFGIIEASETNCHCVNIMISGNSPVIDMIPVFDMLPYLRYISFWDRDENRWYRWMRAR